MEQFKIRGAIGGRTIEATVNANSAEEAEEFFTDLFQKATRASERKIQIIEVESQGVIAGHHVSLAKGSSITIAMILIMLFASCGSTNRGVRHNDGLFYKGYVIKANGERKQKTFIFGRDACIRKSKKMARKRAKRRSHERNPNYGITAGGRAKQR